MEMTYGLKRVAEPQYVLPTSAWKLDNSRNIYPNELRISVNAEYIWKAPALNRSAQRAITMEEKIKQKIIDIIIRRGKLHNPVTDTGGLVFGTSRKSVRSFIIPANLKVGDSIICNASLASVPIQIEDIPRLTMCLTRLTRPAAILHDHVPIIKVEEDMPVNLLLYTLDESGTLYRLSQLAEGQSKFFDCRQ